ncbi:MAG: hypothetical protein GX897_00365 [Clostridiales bacterium]|nr:hypothetical protein [Clostridiales bacterium]
MFTLKNKYLRYSFDEKGLVREYADVSTGISYLAPDSYAFYLSTFSGEKVIPSSVSVCGNIIAVRFDNPELEFKIVYLEKEKYIKFTILDQNPKDVKYGCFILAAVNTTDRDGFAPFSSTARSLCLKCNMLELPGRCEKVGSIAYSKLGAVGVSSALIGVPRDLLVEALDSAIEFLTIDDIPMTAFGGQHGADAPAAHEDYVIASLIKEIDDDEWLKPLKRVNIRQVDFHQGGMYRQSDYVFHPELFPGGAADFKRKVADTLHRNGMRAGLHSYSGMVDVNSRYVTPIPSKDLYALAEYTLACDLGADDETLYIEGSSESVATTQGPHAYSNVTCLLIDEEIVIFKSKGEGGALGSLQRGALGTKAAAHEKGASVRHLRNMYGYFQSIPGSPLFYKLAQNKAIAFNEGGFDMMYFDGLECIGSSCPGNEKTEGLGWYYEALFVREVLRGCKKTPIVEYSTLHPQIWGSRSRAGAYDMPYAGYKQFHDIHCRDNESSSHRRLLPSQLGWLSLWPTLGNPPVHDNWMDKIEFDDDADYLGCKSIGFDSGLSYAMPKASDYEKSPGLCRKADKMAVYSKLREQKYFSAELREKLKAYKTGYRLIEKDGKYCFERLERLYTRPYSFKDGENAGTVLNPFDSQQPTVRIVGECTEDASVEPITIIEFDRERPAAEQQLLYQYPADKPLDIDGKEALGLWVKGNGKDEYMNVRLEGQHPWGEGFGDNVIHLGFEGWRYFNLCECDNGDYAYVAFENDIFDIDSKSYLWQRLREDYKYSGIARIRILFTSGGEGVYLGALTARPFKPSAIKINSLSANGATLNFNCDLTPGRYIEYDPKTGKAAIFDRLGNSDPIGVEGTLKLTGGENEVVVNGEADGTRRVKVHLLVAGEIISD